MSYHNTITNFGENRNADHTPTAPHLPVNEDRDYCERCGEATDLTALAVGGEVMHLCGACERRIRRRAAASGLEIRGVEL